MVGRNLVSPYKRILVPYDGSKMSDYAIEHGTYIAKTANSELTILHVLKLDAMPPAALLGFLRPGDELLEGKERLRKTLELGAQLMLEEKVKEMHALGTSKVSNKLRAGKPSDEIIEELEAGQYDLVVMGSSRITSSIKLLGSTARRVIESTRKPVLLIHE